MPDGTIITDVPDGATQADVQALYDQQKNKGTSEAAGATCPIATQDVATNLKNRQKAINVANYGPLNPGLPNRSFWMAKANIFKTTVKEALTARCGNCAAFNVTTAIENCIDQGLAAGGSGPSQGWDVVNRADLGYCEMWDFKCAATRTCDAWVTGGPVTDANANSTPR